MQPLRDAIKKKYGVSDKESDQVIAALTEIERHRQDSAGSQVQGFRARQPGDANRSKEVPDIGTIVRESSGGRQTSRTSGQVQGSGLIGIILSIIMSIVGMFLSNRQPQGSSNNTTVTNVLTDILGGATTPSQAPDLGSILGGLLESNTGTSSGNQTPDIQDMVQILLNQGSSRR